MRHDVGFLPGFYAQGSAAYSFYGITGWWFDMCTGSDFRMTENLYMGFKFGAVLSSSYWPSSSNGWQSLYFRVTANYRLFGNVFIEPFVGPALARQGFPRGEPRVWKNAGKGQ